MKVKVADIELRDDYIGLPSGVGSVQELLDTALAAIAAVFAKNKADATGFQDNVCSLIAEANNQQVEE